MDAKPNVDSDRHKPPIPMTTISSQRGQRQPLEQEQMYYQASAPGNYKRGVEMKNAAERSQRSFGGKSDDDEA